MNKLPIFDVLPEIAQALCHGDNAVLSAPPGAGKTTQVPLELIQQPWCTGKVVMFEPRRMAARAAACRMADLLGESVGNTVGYRIRGETRVNRNTRIEVVTGGVLSRMLVDDPSLAGYSVVILDEFHERNLDADISLALCLAGRDLFREGDPLKLLVMSATLDAEPIAALLGDAPLIVSSGRMHPVDISYMGQTRLDELVANTLRAVLTALEQTQGHILVFLPGQKEIHAAIAALTPRVTPNIMLCPLYGAMNFEQQQATLAPLPNNSNYQQKVVLATDIAETSLTIDGVTVVVDGGFHRAPQFDPKTCMTRLATQRISRASATQRAGRAGRTAPGQCYRLWAKELPLNAHSSPEILQADLTPLALSLCAFGLASPSELRWLTPPRPHSYQQALKLLIALEAIDPTSHALTPHGKALQQFPTHPRLAHMMLRAAQLNQTRWGVTLAVVLHENVIKQGDLEHTCTQLLHNTKWPYHLQNTQLQFMTALKAANLAHVNKPNELDENILGLLIAFAYPDRIAQKVKASGDLYRLHNGRQARLPKHSALQTYEWLAIAELGGNTGASEDTIYAAAEFKKDWLQQYFANEIKTVESLFWCLQQQRFIAERVTQFGALKLSTQPITQLNVTQRIQAICHTLCEQDFTFLHWSDEATQLCARINLLKELGYAELPDYSLQGLKNTIDEWLAPYLDQVTTIQDLQKIDLLTTLKANMSWSIQKLVDDLTPTHYTVPSGSQIKIDYQQSPPVLAVKLQEMFGQTQTPSIAKGQVKLLVHLLSPARRPLQITQDLAGFWQTSYLEVKKEMKGRYPKHPWPDNPLEAPPTRFTKKRFEPK